MRAGSVALPMIITYTELTRINRWNGRCGVSQQLLIMQHKAQTLLAKASLLILPSFPVVTSCGCGLLLSAPLFAYSFCARGAWLAFLEMGADYDGRLWSRKLLLVAAFSPQWMLNQPVLFSTVFGLFILWKKPVFLGLCLLVTKVFLDILLYIFYFPLIKVWWRESPVHRQVLLYISLSSKCKWSQVEC